MKKLYLLTANQDKYDSRKVISWKYIINFDTITNFYALEAQTQINQVFPAIIDINGNFFVYNSFTYALCEELQTVKFRTRFSSLKIIK